MKIVFTSLMIGISLFVSAQIPSVTETRELQRRNFRPIPKWELDEKRVYRLIGFTDSTQLNFTKKSNCEFDCIGLSDDLLRQILINGQVNVDRSKLTMKPSPHYAVEAVADSGESFRVITSPDGMALRIIAIQRLDKKLFCDCKD